jgi:hypothetical protein
VRKTDVMSRKAGAGSRKTGAASRRADLMSRKTGADAACDMGRDDPPVDPPDRINGFATSLRSII